MIDAPFEKILWRVDSEPFERNGSHVCRYVPYLNAATVAALLDEAVGADNWTDQYEPGTVNGKQVLWCHLSVRRPFSTDGWVTKSDIGYVAGEGELGLKGTVSDSFKRAATLKWGAGRNVYDLPTLWAPCKVDGKGKARENDDTITYIQNALAKRGFTFPVRIDSEADTAGDDEVRVVPGGGGQ